MSTKLPSGKEVKFVPHPNQRKDETTIMVDVSKLDQAWQGDTDYYVAPGEDPQGKKAAFLRFLAKGKPVEASRVNIENGVVSFVDGRHRFAALREEGAKQMAVTIPKKQKDEFLEKFGKNAFSLNGSHK